MTSLEDRTGPPARCAALNWRHGWVSLALGSAALGAGLAVALSPDLAALVETSPATPWAVGALLILYIAVLAVPFVPGAEIGLALMIVFGSVMALPVFVATVLGLSISFLLGRSAAQNGMGRVAETVPRAGGADLAVGVRTRRWLLPLLRFRWLAVIILVNTPGNSVIGGGGGIAMAVGYSRSFTLPAFVACVALAVAPVPIAVLLAEHFSVGIGLQHLAERIPGASSTIAARDWP